MTFAELSASLAVFELRDTREAAQNAGGNPRLLVARRNYPRPRLIVLVSGDLLDRRRPFDSLGRTTSSASNLRIHDAVALLTSGNTEILRNEGGFT